MSTINDYLSSIKKRYPDTQAVREQIEELRDTLHLKTEELQAQGKPYEYAAKEAIESLGDVTSLLEEVAGNVRTVYINRLSRNNALSLSALIYVEFITVWVSVLLNYGYHGGEFLFSLFVLVVGLGTWLLIAATACKREPDKTKVVEFPYRKLMRIALVGWLGLSAFLFVINILTPSSVWFYYPIIGIANWPLGVYLYHRQLTGGRYDA